MQRDCALVSHIASFGGKIVDQKYLSQSHIHFAKNMQFTGNRKNRRSRINPLDSSQNAWTHTHGLQMYKIPPTDNITLEEFEEFAIDRLKGTYMIMS